MDQVKVITISLCFKMTKLQRLSTPNKEINMKKLQEKYKHRQIDMNIVEKQVGEVKWLDL